MRLVVCNDLFLSSFCLQTSTFHLYQPSAYSHPDPFVAGGLLNDNLTTMANDENATVTSTATKAGREMAFRGRLDAKTLPSIWSAAFDPLGSSPPSALVVKLSEVSFCDGAGIGLLVELDRQVRGRGGTVTFDASHLLFVCAGAFEGLYDEVYDRITVGRDRGALQGVSVMDGGEVHHEMRFSLREWLRYEDLFDYGMSPQFLSRFDAVVLLNDLGEQQLVDIFLNSPESGFHQARAYFEAVGVDLAVSPAAVRRIAVEAGKQPRLGARALKEVFRRVIRDYEFQPHESAHGGTLMIDLPEVEAALES